MTAQPIPGPAAAIQDAEWKRIAAEREASIRAIAGDDPHAEINIDMRKVLKMSHIHDPDYTWMNAADMFGDTGPAYFSNLRDGGNIETKARFQGLILAAIFIVSELFVLSAVIVWAALNLVWWLA